MLVTIALGNAFLFGYLIITDQRLICVYFESDMMGTMTGYKPKRSCLEIWATLNSVKAIVAVGQPGFELSPTENFSRQIAAYLLDDIASIRLESKGAKDVSLTSLIIKLKQGDETSITFYGMHDAEKTQKLIQANQIT